MNLIDLSQLNAERVRAIWALVDTPCQPLQGKVAWSFEGNGIRTRTSFIQAFQELGLSFVELPNLLKTPERAADLAGYLDPFYDVYVVRESNHQRLAEFAFASQRPVINAMSSLGHPCEVLTDAFYIVITDGWPSGAEAMAKSLTVADLDCMGMPMLLATPPFSIGREIAFDPVQYPRFSGYSQKSLLLPVQKAILRYLLAR